MSKILCIYHGNCDDGFAAAWTLRAALGSQHVEFYPGVYQQEPPDVRGRDVVMVDFSYKKPVIERMSADANSILILDHHKTAYDDLVGYPSPPLWCAWYGIAHDDVPLSKTLRTTAQFDMERCGATMAWDYFHGADRPEFLSYIEDRDLWRKALPDGDAFTMALRSYPQDFEVWDRLVKDGPYQLISEGKTILRYYRLRIEELKRHRYRARFHPSDQRQATDEGLICNAPYAFASEVAGELAEESGTWGACFFEVEAGKFQYSLRSRGDYDVSAIALRFGGGGHKNAAGFATWGRAHAADAKARE
ncbi:MAG: phosphohydrolase [Patescibacteria group bacterium]|nr:phosphohydrolase [Patescibacteria group bacterium]